MLRGPRGLASLNAPNIYSTGARAMVVSGSSDGIARAPVNGLLAACKSMGIVMQKNSKQIGGLVGPVIAAMIVSEFPLVQPHLYDAQIPPVVYLSGTLMLVGGLAIVRIHNHWARDWSVLLTLVGWFSLLLGLTRMFAASAYLQSSAKTSPTIFMVLEGILLIIGLIITFKSYRRNGK